MAHTIYCRIPTPQEKKELQRQAMQNRENKQTTGKNTVARSKTESKGKAYSEMTSAEKRRIDDILRKSNGQIRQKYGIGSDLAGVEFR